MNESNDLTDIGLNYSSSHDLTNILAEDDTKHLSVGAKRYYVGPALEKILKVKPALNPRKVL